MIGELSPSAPARTQGCPVPASAGTAAMTVARSPGNGVSANASGCRGRHDRDPFVGLGIGDAAPDEPIPADGGRPAVRTLLLDVGRSRIERLPIHARVRMPDASANSHGTGPRRDRSVPSAAGRRPDRGELVVVDRIDAVRSVGRVPRHTIIRPPRDWRSGTVTAGVCAAVTPGIDCTADDYQARRLGSDVNRLANRLGQPDRTPIGAVWRKPGAAEL